MGIIVGKLIAMWRRETGAERWILVEDAQGRQIKLEIPPEVEEEIEERGVLASPAFFHFEVRPRGDRLFCERFY
ncbi:hypothetical protein J7L13_00445 [bacterium]|nr:hypothetical protein [bacterium]